MHLMKSNRCDGIIVKLNIQYQDISFSSSFKDINIFWEDFYPAGTMEVLVEGIFKITIMAITGRAARKSHIPW